MRIAVIGGGIAGLTSALAFAKQGASVCVYEQAADLTEVGAGLQITPNGARALLALGVWDALVSRGVRAEAVVPTDALSGQQITRFDLSHFDPGYLFIHRAAFVDVLAQAAVSAGVDLALGQRVETPPSVDLIVAAQGLHSTTRARLNSNAAPFFTGQVAWRALIKSDAPPEARIWMAPGRHVVTYPLQHGWLNIVAVQERGTWAAEGWHHPDDPAHLHAAFADTSDSLKSLLAKVETPHLWGLFRHPVAQNWHDDASVLLGDAAHPTLPFLAQGANLAIEDAYVMAQCVKTLGQNKGLAHYQTLRAPRVTRAINAANANARNYHLSGPKRHIAHLGLKTLGALAPKAFLNRMDWLYGHDVTQPFHLAE